MIVGFIYLLIFGIFRVCVMELMRGFGVVIVGEIANFIAYIFAPAVLVTPLGALSIIVR